MFSSTTKLSLCQLLVLVDVGPLDLLLEKYGAQPNFIAEHAYANREMTLRDWVMIMSPMLLRSLIDELGKTSGTARLGICPRYAFDQRWQDFCARLELDGYRVDEEGLKQIEPELEAGAPVIDELRLALRASGLPAADEIERMVQASIEHYTRAEPDYNACLNSARVALQTLGTAIAFALGPADGAKFDKTKWGSVVSYLKIRDFIGPSEEAALTGVFMLVSPGSHRPIGMTEQEYIRLGRSLVTSMTYFLVRRFNGFVGR